MIISYKTKYYEIISEKKPLSKSIIKKCSDCYKVNKKFFGKNCKPFKIIICYDEKEFKRVTTTFDKDIYAPWVKGIGHDGKIIVIRSPVLHETAFQKTGGTRKFEMTLTHEINHVFADQWNLYKGPYWIFEALAMYVAGQIPGKTYKLKIKLTKKIVADSLMYRKMNKKVSNKMYESQYYTLNFLLYDYGKKKVISLLNSYKKNMNQKYFKKKFENIFGINYDGFINNSIERIISKK